MENHIAADSVSYNDTRCLLAGSTMVTRTNYRLFCFLQNVIGMLFIFDTFLYIYSTLYNVVW